MVDSDSPLNETLMTYIRQNLIHLEEWLGASYTAAQDHDHDGTNSKKVVGVGTDAVDQAAIANSAVGQGELKTTSGAVGGLTGNYTLPGGLYGFYPQFNSSVGATTHDAQIALNYTTGTGNYITNIYLDRGGAGSVYARQAYIQASPPYMIGTRHWEHFLFLLRKTDGEIVGGYEAPDPPWAYNGPMWNPKDSPERIAIVPHPFGDYILKNPQDDGLEIVLVDLNEINIEQWQSDCAKKKKFGILDNLKGVISPPLDNKNSIVIDGEITGFTDIVHIKKPR